MLLCPPAGRCALAPAAAPAVVAIVPCWAGLCSALLCVCRVCVLSLRGAADCAAVAVAQLGAAAFSCLVFLAGQLRCGCPAAFCCAARLHGCTAAAQCCTVLLCVVFPLRAVLCGWVLAPVAGFSVAVVGRSAILLCPPLLVPARALARSCMCPASAMSAQLGGAPLCVVRCPAGC